MNEFHHQLQMLGVNDFQASTMIPWDQSQQYMMNDSRQFVGFGGCFGFGLGCFGLGCFGCFGCGGFGRCGGCGGRCGRCHR